MTGSVTRIKAIELNRFKNVNHGRIEISNRRRPSSAGIAGIYGQNGSGKTALIDSLDLLKHLMSNREVPGVYADYVTAGANDAWLIYEFEVQGRIGTYEACYECKIRKRTDLDDLNGPDFVMEGDSSLKRVIVFDEVLSFSFVNDEKKIRKTRLIDCTAERTFLPDSKYLALVTGDYDCRINLAAARKLAYNSSKSFIFSNDLLNEIRKKPETERSFDYEAGKELLEALIQFGKAGLFVIPSRQMEKVRYASLPLAIRLNGKATTTSGMIEIPMNRPHVVSQSEYEIISAAFEQMNLVLENVIPGMSIVISDLGSELTMIGKAGKRIEFISRRNGRDIPLKYESDGIKKMLSVLQLLIALYNEKSVTVAIDELDAGIFEYLLGEILRIVSEGAKGQLIFTSHNLRPMETIDKGFIVFTTCNPDNRYIRMTGVKTTNNLRDFYYRDIMLGESNEQIYDAANSAEIAFAFREAGMLNGKEKNSSCNR